MENSSEVLKSEAEGKPKGEETQLLRGGSVWEAFGCQTRLLLLLLLFLLLFKIS